MSRKRAVSYVALALTAVIFTAVATIPAIAASEPIVYPAKGQSKEQVEKDKYACYSWAKEKTGYDPANASAQATAPAQEKKGGAVKGAAKGALAGAAVGAVAGDTGKGAAVGAAAGGTAGAVKKRRGEKEQQAAAQQQAAAADQKLTDYYRAWGACMEGKGYTIK